MFRRWRNRVTPLDWLCALASLGRRRLHGLPGARVRRSRHRPRSARLLRRRRPDPAAARGDAALQRLDHAGGVAALHRLRLVRQASAAALDASRLFHRAPRRPSLHDARGHLRHHGRRVVEPHHPVHDFRRDPAIFRRRKILHRLLVRGHGRAVATRRAALSCCPRSCSAARPAPAWPRRSRSARSPIRCWRRRATRRTLPAGCWPPAGSVPSSRRPCSARPRS